MKWDVIYAALRRELFRFYLKHKEKSGEELFDRCVRDREFVALNPWLRRKGTDKTIRSIDPIQFFTSFNESGLKDPLRTKRINCLQRILRGRLGTYRHIDFTGCPTPLSIKILASRDIKAQKEIWNLFEQILSGDQTWMSSFDRKHLRNWYGVEIISFTIFLFWIYPSRYIPLDRNTIALLLDRGKINAPPNSIKEYNALLAAIPTKYYRELVAEAYRTRTSKSQGVNYNLSPDLYNFLYQEERSSTFNFRVVAIRPLPGLKRGYLKVLDTNKVYPFYNVFNFDDPNNIKLNVGRDLNLSKRLSDSININLSAIVGKNGTGKSTLSELLFLIINNLTEILVGKESGLMFVPKVNAELFYQSNTLYCLRIAGRTLKVFRYHQTEIGFDSPKRFTPTKEFLENLFYTVAVNYSHFSLNSRQTGSWIEKVFLKNDAYQVPLVINPMRKNGIIDVNTENQLVKSRLLANILEPTGPNDENSLRIISENGRRAKILRFTINHEKLKSLPNNKPFPPLDFQQRKVLNTLYTRFGVPSHRRVPFRDAADRYIFKKLVSIAVNYPTYERFYNPMTNEFPAVRVLSFVRALKRDTSHVTFKLRQAINSIKYSHFSSIANRKQITVAELSARIESVIQKNYSRERLRTIDLVPPSFFEIEVILDDGTHLDHLSSGEKQMVHVMNSLLYHVLNINSVLGTGQLRKYFFVNLVLDEIELYFHPEMQRKFVAKLLAHLSKLTMSDVLGLNICLITHSPFILSDIPNQNTLFLKVEKKKSTPFPNVQNTFGGNIHDILRNSFFLDGGLLGDFAKGTINDAVTYLKKVSKNREEEKLAPFWTRDKVLMLIETIGEPLIKTSLKILFNETFMTTTKEIDKEIAQLEEQKKRLVTQDHYDSSSD